MKDSSINVQDLPIFNPLSMEKTINIKLVKFYLWVAFGMLLIGVLSIARDYPGMLTYLVLNNAWVVIYAIVINFILFEYSIPFILRKRKTIVSNILLGGLLLFLHLMLYSYGLYAWRVLGIQLTIYTELKEHSTVHSVVEDMMAYSAGSFFVFGISRHVYAYLSLRQAAQQLRIEKQEAELNYLKSQTNPHFLFNTLNNIYSLARDKSDLAPESVLRLSKILRFMLYETGGDYVTIEQEIKIISDYIALEKLRYDESLRINFNYEIEDMKQLLPPLLMIPLVENAFKHGVSETRLLPFVDIQLSVRENQLELSVKNSTEQFSGDSLVKENIGLSNLRRQLELLYKDYFLSVKQGQSDFTAFLKINLASHV